MFWLVEMNGTNEVPPDCVCFIFIGLWGRQAWAEGRCPDGYFPTGGEMLVGRLRADGS